MLIRLSNIVCLSVLLWCGCATRQFPKAVQPHPIFKDELLIVPKGNKVGKRVTEKDGVYMSKDVFFRMVIELLQKCDKKDNDLRWTN